MSGITVSSNTQRGEEARAVAKDYEGLTDDEMIETILSMHKPSANPLVRTVWAVSYTHLTLPTKA